MSITVGGCRDLEEPVRRDSKNDREVAAYVGRIKRVEGSKRDAFNSHGRKTCAMTAPDWTEFTALWPLLDSSKHAKSLWNWQFAWQIVNTGHIGRRRGRHPADVGLSAVSLVTS